MPRIILVRHGESESNANPRMAPDTLAGTMDDDTKPDAVTENPSAPGSLRRRANESMNEWLKRLAATGQIKVTTQTGGGCVIVGGVRMPKPK